MTRENMDSSEDCLPVAVENASFAAEDLDAAIDLDDIDAKLEEQLNEKLADLDFLEKERAKIASPEALGETIKAVICEQFNNQIGVTVGTEFIEKNNGLTLDLSDDAHIQTAENFAKGKIATHNTTSKEQLEYNYDRYKNTPHKEFRKEHVDPNMDATLPRAGELNKDGIETVKDIYTGRQIPTATKLENGKNNPEAAQREHVIPSAKVYKDPSLQMSQTDEELAKTINHPDNLQGFTTAERNNRKSDNSPAEMEDRDKNKHWEKANERAEQHIKRTKEEGEKRLREEGKQTQKQEALRMGGETLRAVLMQLLGSLLKEIIAKLVQWFKSAERKISTFIASVKEAIKSFLQDFWQHLKNSMDVAFTTILTAIVGPVVGLIKKVWIFLKQGWRSLKEAVNYLRDPANKDKPMDILIAEVGKIMIAGLSAVGAIALGETITITLSAFPVFAIEIPLLGSIASLVGIFIGAVVAGIIGAIAINKIDKYVAKRQIDENTKKQIDKGNEILTVLHKLEEVKTDKLEITKKEVSASIINRHMYVAETSIPIYDATRENSKRAADIHARIEKFVSCQNSICTIDEELSKSINNISAQADEISAMTDKMKDLMDQF